MDENKQTSDQDLEQVTGGTFDPNALSKEQYAAFGIKVTCHFFSKDEFELPDGRIVEEAEANEYCRKKNRNLYYYYVLKRNSPGGTW